MTFHTNTQYLHTVLPACFAQFLCKPDNPSLPSHKPSSGVGHGGLSHPKTIMLFGNGVLNPPHLTPGTYLGHLH